MSLWFSGFRFLTLQAGVYGDSSQYTRVKKLGMLKQDSRDRVPANHPDATFYTNPDLRSIIDRILNYLKI